MRVVECRLLASELGAFAIVVGFLAGLPAAADTYTAKVLIAPANLAPDTPTQFAIRA